MAFGFKKLGRFPPIIFPLLPPAATASTPTSSSFFDFEFHEMFSGEMHAQAHAARAAQAAAGSARGPSPSTAGGQDASSGRNKLEAKLSALLMNASVKEATMDVLGNNDINTCLLYTSDAADE